MKKRFFSVLFIGMSMTGLSLGQNAGKPAGIPNFYTYTHAANEGFVGPVHTVTTVTKAKTLDFFRSGQSYVEYSREGYYLLYRTSGEGRTRYKENEILLSRRALEGRVYNVANAWSGKVTGDFSVNRGVVPLGGPVIPSAGTATYTYDGSGRLESVKVGNAHTFTYRYDGDGRLLDRLLNGKPLVRLKRQGGLLSSAHQYSNDGSETDRASFTWSLGMEILQHYWTQPSGFRFDDEGRVTRISGRTGSGNNSNMFIRTFEYRNGLVVTEKYEDADTDYTCRFEYDGRGNVTRIRASDVSYTFRYAYNAKGDWTRRTCYKVRSGDIDLESEVFTQTREITYY